jgi:preprotein translocase subunit YajC
MMKKILIAAILAGSVYSKRGYLGILLGLEVCFVIMRFILERPQTKSQKATIII